MKPTRLLLAALVTILAAACAELPTAAETSDDGRSGQVGPNGRAMQSGQVGPNG